jgi:hypothetical protein
MAEDSGGKFCASENDVHRDPQKGRAQTALKPVFRHAQKLNRFGKK